MMAKPKKDKADKGDKLMFLRRIRPDVHKFIKEQAQLKGYCESVVVNRIVKAAMSRNDTSML